MMTFQPSKLIMTRIMIRASFAALPPSYQEFWPTHFKDLSKGELHTYYYNRKVWHVKFCNRCVLSSKKILPGSLGMKSIGTGCVRATLIFHNRPWYILFLISSINWKFHWIYVNLCLEMLEFMPNYFLFVFLFRRFVGICALSRALEHSLN